MILFNASKQESLNYSFCLKDSDFQYIMDESLGINDECIDFWWDKVQQLSPECQESEEGVIFICPSAMYMVNTTDNLENLGEILADLNLHRKGLILMPVNDYLSNTASGTARGTHWSLLCYIRTQNQFRLYDSLGRHNQEAAYLAYARLSPIINASGGN